MKKKRSPSKRSQIPAAAAPKTKPNRWWIMIVVFGMTVIAAEIWRVTSTRSTKARDEAIDKQIQAGSRVGQIRPEPNPVLAPGTSLTGNNPRANGAPRAYSLAPANRNPRHRFWWNGVPEAVQTASLKSPGMSNIRPMDYVGPDACKTCHAANYKGWSEHPHRFMNAVARVETVKGDFSGNASLDYKRGRATFFQQDGGYRMRLARDNVQRTFAISRTIGSRFFQYYIGRLIDGPEHENHPLRSIDHVLPFGYWLAQHQWVPTVHVDEVRSDNDRNDPFVNPSDAPYDKSCAMCHTTRPIADWMLGGDGSSRRLEYFAPHPSSLAASAYLSEAHPEILQAKCPSPQPTQKQFARLVEFMGELPPEDVTALGITCEACHNGCKEHVERSTASETTQPPLFYPAGPLMFVQGNDAKAVWGRTSENVNWICARCHSGARPQFAAGMATWNSTEYSDAELGHCYDASRARQNSMQQLTCVTCHNPHKATGSKWSASSVEDDAKCLKCHDRYQQSSRRVAHTHHPDGSAGGHCMECHMPRLNEGIQDVVRTHMIFNPTEPRMIEANQPNACNLCHLEKPIDWTLKYLYDWYGKTYQQENLVVNYPDRQGPVALGWLKSKHEPTRLVAAEALARAKAQWALPALIDILDDPFPVNRQFMQKDLEESFGLDLKGAGYRCSQTMDERQAPLARLRAIVLTNASKKL